MAQKCDNLILSEDSVTSVALSSFSFCRSGSATSCGSCTSYITNQRFISGITPMLLEKTCRKKYNMSRIIKIAVFRESTLIYQHGGDACGTSSWHCRKEESHKHPYSRREDSCGPNNKTAGKGIFSDYFDWDSKFHAAVLYPVVYVKMGGKI